MSAREPSSEIVIARGSIYLSRELCDAHFAGTVSVALIARAGAVLIVPLRSDSVGGLLLKQRNARGDRIIHAQEFLRDHGVAESFEPCPVPVHWDADSAALSIEGLSLK